MADSVKEFFDGLPARVDAGRTAGVNTTYLFDIEGAGQWVVSVTDDGVQVREGPGDAACTITTTEETFLKIANGDQNPTSAYMTGKLKVKGDMGAALKLQKRF